MPILMACRHAATAAAAAADYAAAVDDGLPDADDASAMPMLLPL